MIRRAAAALVLALALGMTTACQPEPAPSPSAPVFATEDEAFAAAEETYRGYVDALNQLIGRSGDILARVSWTTVEAERTRDEVTELGKHARPGWPVSGLKRIYTE